MLGYDLEQLVKASGTGNSWTEWKEYLDSTSAITLAQKSSSICIRKKFKTNDYNTITDEL